MGAFTSRCREQLVALGVAREEPCAILVVGGLIVTEFYRIVHGIRKYTVNRDASLGARDVLGFLYFVTTT